MTDHRVGMGWRPPFRRSAGAVLVVRSDWESMSGNDFSSDFAEHGFARIDRAFADSVAGMADAVWAELRRRHGILRTQRSTWTVAEPRGLGALRKRGVFEPLATPAVRAAISELLGHADWPHPFSWGDPLVTFPTPGEWFSRARTGWWTG